MAIDLVISIVILATNPYFSGDHVVLVDGGVDGPPLSLFTNSVYQLVVSILTTIISVVCLVIIAPKFDSPPHMRLYVIVFLKFISIIGDVYGSNSDVNGHIQLIIIDVAVVLRLLEVIFLFILLLKARREQRRIKKSEAHPKLLDILKNNSKEEEKLLENSLHCIERLDNWLVLKNGRRSLRRKFWIGQHVLLVVSLLTFVLTYLRWFSEFNKIASTQNPFFRTEVLDAMNDASKITSYFGENRTNSQNKVVLVVLDGLRYDYISSNVAFSQFLQEPEFANNSKLFKIRSQLPSMSVPNWISIITGSPPETTGVLGNLLVSEIGFDSIFNMAKNFQMNRGLTGSPWFADIVKSKLPYLSGDGTIAITVGATNSHSADAADKLRFEVLKEALSDTQRPYPLFLIHFSDIDIQGHCCGVTTKWNKEDTYNSAITNKTEILRQLVDIVDEDTILWIVSDHGHVDRGGHGGISEILLEVPLIVYKKNSNFQKQTWNGPRFSDSYDNLDIAGTICANLGIPVPRQSAGRFIDDAMIFTNQSTLLKHYQKKLFVSSFMKQTGNENVLKEKWFDDGYLNGSTNLEDYVNAVNEMLSKLKEKRDRALTLDVVRDCAVSILVVLFLAAIFMFGAQAYSFVDIISLFKYNQNQKINRKTFLIALVVTTIFFLSTLCSYLILYAIYGYPSTLWDSTVVHTPEVLPMYAFFCIGPAIFFTYLLSRILHLKYSKWPISKPGKKYRTFIHRFTTLLGVSPQYTEIDIIYLTRIYMLLLSVVFCWLMTIISSMYTFAVPELFNITYISTPNWKYRFQLVTVLFFSIPFIIGNLITLYTWPKISVASPMFDKIYQLKIRKDYAEISESHQYFIFKDESLVRSYDDISQAQHLLASKNL